MGDGTLYQDVQGFVLLFHGLTLLLQDFHRFGVAVGVLLLPLGAYLSHSADTPRHNAGLHETHNPGDPGLQLPFGYGETCLLRGQARVLVGDGGGFKL